MSLSVHRCSAVQRIHGLYRASRILRFVKRIYLILRKRICSGGVRHGQFSIFDKRLWLGYPEFEASAYQLGRAEFRINGRPTCGLPFTAWQHSLLCIAL